MCFDIKFSTELVHSSLLVELLHEGKLNVVCTRLCLLRSEGVVQDAKQTLSSSRVGGVSEHCTENLEESRKPLTLANPPLLHIEAVVLLAVSIDDAPFLLAPFLLELVG